MGKRIIHGPFEREYGFIMVYADDNRVYSLATGNGNPLRDWGSRGVGEMTHMGHPITQEIFDLWKSECTKEGTFELIDDE